MSAAKRTSKRSPSPTRERAEAYRVDRANDDAGGERVGLVAVVDLQLKADVAHGDPDAQRAARADGELAADVERVGDPAAGRDLAAVAAAVDAELDELVADAEGEGRAQLGGVGGEEVKVAGRDAGDGGAGRVVHV